MSKKISELTSPSLPLAGTELIEMSQSATSVQVTVDELEAAVDHNNLAGLQGGDSTTGEFYHVTQAEKAGIFSGSPVIGLGESVGTNVTVDYGTHSITTDVNSTEVLNMGNLIQSLGDKAGANPYIEVQSTDGETNDVITLFRSAGSFIELGPNLNIEHDHINIFNSASALSGMEVYIGQDKVGHADVRLYGSATGSVNGGRLTLFSAFDYESNLDDVEIKINEDDFSIHPNSTVVGNEIEWDGAGESWQINALGSIILEATATTRLGSSGGTRITQSSSLIESYISTEKVIEMDGNYQRFGEITTGNYLEVFDGGGEANATIKLISAGASMTFDVGGTTTWDISTMWIIASSGTTNLHIGNSGISKGELAIYGGLTADNQGARILLHTADDFDSPLTNYFIDVSQDDFLIYPNGTGNLDALKYDGGLEQWIMNATNGTRINNGLNLDGTDVVATADDLNTKEFTVFLADISAANEISFVSPVDGTCFIVYSSVTGDPGADAIISGNINDGTAFTDIMTISNGSAQHTVDSMSPTDNNEIIAGETVRFISNGGASNAVGIWLTVVVTL